jgi:hypothetical protein
MGKLLLRTYGAVPTTVDNNEFVSLSQPILLRLRVDESTKTVSCLRASGKAFAELTLEDGGPWHPGLEAGDVAGFSYFDLIQR